MARQSRNRPWRRAAAFIFLGFLITPAHGCAQGNGDPANDPRFEQAVDLFEAWLDAKMAYEKIPGVSVALVHDQDLVWARGYGYAHPETQVAATPSTMYSVCSISKLFTSIGVMQQRDEGNVDLDDPVSDHLPWYNLEQAYPDAPGVSLEGILTHSSGLPRESAHPYWTGPDHPFPTRDEIIEGLSGQVTLYPGRRYFQYSNLGMALAGQLVEQSSGMAYDDYVRSRILDPLGMSDTYTDIPAEHRGDRYATGHARLARDGGRDEAPFFQALGMAPAAGFASTVEDLARLASWQFRLLENGGTEILDVNTLREMHRVHWVDPDFDTMWGLGFAVSRRDGERTVGHGGSCPGFRSTFQLIPAKKLAGVVMMNALANPTDVWTKMMATLGAAFEEIQSDPGGGVRRPASLAEYEGLYQSTWGETVILRWDDGLAALGVPSNDPLEAMTKLRHEDGDTFRRVRDDGEPGEAYIFHREDGAIARYSVHGNFSNRVR
ncbi:serine hydrolase domain-containing protein [Candidatus Palauibacter sp.]|uniref:serine hydrolase domain-containing protein n=1 Tax=Candidatus Palauibacter sp. TaxID=3101350 RepID=UPI003B02E3E2